MGRRLPRLIGIEAVRRWLADGPAYPASEADRHAIDVLGLRLPLRATVAIAVVTLVLLADVSRTFLPDEFALLGRSPVAMRVVALERALLFGLVPLAILLFVFRERPSRYGLAIGDWRAGASLTLLGCAIMTPLVLCFATFPDARAYYGQSVEPLSGLLLTNAIDIAASEFLFRGFLTFVLLRAIGPTGVVVAAMPFVYVHLGKPELELVSTLLGGLVYGWLAWRTRSILWGTIGHVYVLSLVIVAAGATAAATGAGIGPTPT